MTLSADRVPFAQLRPTVRSGSSSRVETMIRWLVLMIWWLCLSASHPSGRFSVVTDSEKLKGTAVMQVSRGLGGWIVVLGEVVSLLFFFHVFFTDFFSSFFFRISVIYWLELETLYGWLVERSGSIAGVEGVHKSCSQRCRGDFQLDLFLLLSNGEMCVRLGKNWSRSGRWKWVFLLIGWILVG